MKRKTKLIVHFLLMLFTVQAFAQFTEKNRLLDKTVNAAEIIRADTDLIMRQNDGRFYAVVSGKVYNLRESGGFIRGKVKYASDGIIVIENADGLLPDLAITNYNGDATSEKDISVCAIRAGTYDYGGVPLELWDCGKPYVPPSPTPEQIKATQEAANLAALRAKQKVLEGQTNTVRWLQSQATNGDVSAQCSLGEHYLAGLGCETNRDLAIQWLQKAADGGSEEASNKLLQLKSP